MGKGNRNDQQKLDKQLAQEERLLAKEKAKKSKKKSDRMIAAACIVIAVLIVAILVLNVLSETGVFLRVQDAVYLSNNADMKVNASMMTYFVNDTITQWYNQYYMYVAYGMVSIDMTNLNKPMNGTDKSYMGDDWIVANKTTWKEYFIEKAKENVELYLTYANAADKKASENVAECKLTEEDRNEINDTIKELKKSLRENNMTIADQYGKGVTESDIRACLELAKKAEKFSNYNRDTLEAGLLDKDDPIKQYPKDHKDEFEFANYLSYTISVNEKTEKTQLKFDEAKKAADRAAEKIKQATTPAEFVTLIEQYKKSPATFAPEETTTGTNTDVTESSGSESATETATETATSTETATEKSTATETETKIEDLIDKYEESIYYGTEDEVEKWIFVTEAETYDIYVEKEDGTELATTKKSTSTATEESTKPSLVEVETTTNGEIVYETYKVTVYMLMTKPDMDHSFTSNIAYLISTDEKAVTAFMAEFSRLADKDKTRDKFVELAENFTPEHEHTEEEHEEPVFSYQKVDRAKKNFFNDDYNELNEWIESPDRKAPECSPMKTITVKSGSGESATETKYFAVIYLDKPFEGEKGEAWYADAFSGALSDAIDNWYEQEKKKNPVKFEKAVIDDLVTIGG